MKKRLVSFFALLLAILMTFTACNVPQGEKGDKGDKGDKGEKGDTGAPGSSLTVVSCEKTATEGLVDTYTLTFSDGSSYTFTVNNGAQGETGETGDKGDKGDKGDTGVPGASITVVSCEKTASEGLTDTYTITFSDGTTAEFQITNSPAGITVADISYTESSEKYKISYSDGTYTEFTVPETSKAVKAYDDAVKMGYSATKSEFIISAVASAKTKLLADGSPIEAKIFGSVILTMLNEYNTYFETLNPISSIVTAEVTENAGYMFAYGTVGVNSPSQNYVYTNPIPCKQGDLMEICFDSNPLTLRFITAFKDGSCVVSASVDANNMNKKSYAVPSGVDSVVFSYTKQSSVSSVKITSYDTIPTVKNSVTVSDVNKLYYGINNDANVTVDNTSIYATADVLKAGEYLKLENNNIMNEKTLSLSFKVDSFSENDTIKLGHGESKRGASYIELTKTHIKSYDYTSSNELRLNEEHGLTLSGVVNITITTRLYDADVTISSSASASTDGDIICTKKIDRWAGRIGDIFAVSTASDITDVRMRWFSSAYEHDIWILGDSYISSLDSSRWPYYLRLAGYSEYLLAGYPGRKSDAGIEDFKLALTHGTPKYAIWCLGMNNGDNNDSINESYLESVQEFIRVCEEKGITPILATIPCTPTINNYYKNQWVKNSGYRYIDFARAVGAEEVGSSWYTGMLHTDNTHPSKLGAKALYGQFIADFPEIMRNQNK